MKPYVPWQYSNFILRVSLGLFLFLWGLDKIMAPEDTVKIFEHFYKTSIGPGIAVPLGIGEMFLGAAIAVGLFRSFTFGLGLILHLVSTLSSWKQMLDPWGRIWNAGKNSHLFLASLPVLAAFIVLFMNRSDDYLTLDRKLRRV